MGNSKIINESNEFKKEIYSSKYLYSVDGSYFRNMSYKEAIKEKIRLGKELLERLSNIICDMDIIGNDSYNVINERIVNVKKAIEHNEMLLKDMR